MHTKKNELVYFSVTVADIKRVAGKYFGDSNAKAVICSENSSPRAWR